MRLPGPASGLSITALARDLNHPRWLHVLPNGDVLVAETNAPERPERSGPKTFVMNQVMKRAGAARAERQPHHAAEGRRWRRCRRSPHRIPDEASTRRSEWRWSATICYVANTDAVVRFPYSEGQTKIDQAGVKVADLPAGPLNHHWTKGLIANRDGTKLYASVGSNSNVAENGIEKEENRATIIEIDVKCGQSRVFASGLRNPVGMAWNPQNGELWAVVNERDEIGSDLVPDYLTSVKDGGFYGWPYSYFGKHVDTRVKPERPDLVAKAIVPDYALGNHVAPLGLTFAAGEALPEQSPQRRLCRPARLLEQEAAQRIQGGLRSVRERASFGQTRRCAHRLPDRGGRGDAAARSASKSIAAARCWWPTMSATWCGGCPARFARSSNR